MKNILKRYKVFIVLVLVAMCMSSCYVDYPYGNGYSHGYYGRHHYHRPPHYHHYYGY